MVYAGFWKRFFAALIDFLPFMLFGQFFFYLQKQSLLSYAIYQTATSLLWIFYHVWFHGRFGQTPGKMLLKIKVFRTDFTSINYKTAALRSSIDAVFGVAILALALFHAASLPAFDFANTSDTEFIKAVRSPHENLLYYITTAWSVSDVFLVLFNRKRRSLHDFIAGTVVIKIKSPEISL